MKDFAEREGYGFLGITFAFLGGALAGAATALLLAPKSGEETRKQLKELANTGLEAAQKAPGRLREYGETAKEKIASRLTSSSPNGDLGNTRH